MFFQYITITFLNFLVRYISNYNFSLPNSSLLIILLGNFILVTILSVSEYINLPPSFKISN